MPFFGRMLTAMASPMRRDHSLDLEGVQRLAEHLVDHGSDGLVVAGTTGESPTLTERETANLFAAVLEAVGDRATVLAGAGKNDTATTLQLVREASAIGVDGVMLVTPYYNKPSQRGLYEHFATVAGATELPVLLYNIPSRTSCEIAPETLLRLSEDVPTIRGVKDSVKDFGKAAWLAARAPETFEIYSGNDEDTLPLLSVGAVGAVSVAAHLVGSEIGQMIDRFATDPAGSLRIHQRLLGLFAALFVDTNPVPVKAALDMVGLPGGPVRPPLAGADAYTVESVRLALEHLGIEADGTVVGAEEADA